MHCYFHNIAERADPRHVDVTGRHPRLLDVTGTHNGSLWLITAARTVAGQLHGRGVQVAGGRHAVAGLDVPGRPRLLPLAATESGRALLPVLGGQEDQIASTYR